MRNVRRWGHVLVLFRAAGTCHPGTDLGFFRVDLDLASYSFARRPAPPEPLPPNRSNPDRSSGETVRSNTWSLTRWPRTPYPRVDPRRRKCSSGTSTVLRRESRLTFSRGLLTRQHHHPGEGDAREAHPPTDVVPEVLRRGGAPSPRPPPICAARAVFLLRLLFCELTLELGMEPWRLVRHLQRLL